jgi:hypothetical protein
MKKATITMFALALSSLLVAAAQQGTTPAGQQPTTPPTSQSNAPPVSQQGTQPAAQPNTIPSSRANNPAPASGAHGKTQRSSVGRGSLTVTTARQVSFWQEEASYGGATVTTDFLYDPNIGVLYGYREDDYTCANGQTGHGGILEALNTSGNTAGKPPGSGWWMVDMSDGKCGAKQSGTYGCRFDQNGNATECGAATVNHRTGEIDVVAVQ